MISIIEWETERGKEKELERARAKTCNSIRISIYVIEGKK